MVFKGALYVKAHLSAVFTILVWGTTFVSTKVLLETLTPIEVLFIRFAIGFIALVLLRRHMLKLSDRKHEILFAAAGCTGVAIYFMLENVALVYTHASVVGALVATTPLFTAVLSQLLGSHNRLGGWFVVGFILAMIGVVLVSFPLSFQDGGIQFVVTSESSEALSQGAHVAQSNDALWGFLLALGASMVWAVYSNIISKLGEAGYETVALTKRSFAWGLLFIALAMPWMGFGSGISLVPLPINIANLLFLGLIASAACFITWNYAVKHLGPARTAAYIYLAPVITVSASAIVLGEPFTPQIVFGMALTVGGLFLSEYKGKVTPSHKRS